jgi:hypothetical protein
MGNKGLDDTIVVFFICHFTKLARRLLMLVTDFSRLLGRRLEEFYLLTGRPFLMNGTGRFIPDLSGTLTFKY